MKKRIIQYLICIAAVATLALLVAAAKRPLAAGELGFMALGTSPYVYLLFLNRWAATRAAINATLVIAVLAGSLGVWLPVDAFLHSDPQSALVFLFVPLWQWFLLLIATMPLYLLNRRVACTDDTP